VRLIALFSIFVKYTECPEKMKNISPLFSIVIALVLFASCSKNDFAQKTEYDDMYFSSADRDKLTASTKEFYTENFNDTYVESLNSEKAVDYSDINYSSKTINPEYIAKYTSDNLDQDVSDESTEYYSDDLANAEIYGEAPKSYSSYSGSNGGGIYPTFAFGGGSGYGGNPYGYRDPYGFGYGYQPGYYSRFRTGLSFRIGYGSFYNPYSYSPYGYSPYRYSSYGYDPFRYNNYSNYYGSSYNYCPSPFTGYAQQNQNYYNNTGIDISNKVVAVRKVTRSPRSSRGSTYVRNTDGNRGSGNGKVYIPDGSIQASGRNTGDRNNYYRRTGTRSTDNSSTRGYQSSRTYNASSDYTRSRTSGVTSNYSRSSKPNNSRNSFLKNIVSGNTNRSSGQSRSSGSYSRSGSSSRTFSSPSRSSYSGSSRSSGSVSSPSRSSSGSSSGTSRSSGSRGSGRGN